jgi:hypothetical protein
VKQYLSYHKKQTEFFGGILIDEQKLMEGCGIVTWTHLEDLALKKPEESAEF